MSGDPAGTALVDPRTCRTRGEMPVGRGAEVDEAVSRCRRATGTWAALTARQRADRLFALAATMETALDEYAAAERAGTGKPEGDARAEVAEAIDLFRFYAGAARAALTPAAGGHLADHESWVRWEPLGVIGVIVPWNYPLMMAVWRCAPALAAGNGVVIKPAETTPDSVLLLAAQAAEALGPDVVRVVTGDRDTGRLLIEANVDAIAFTGSERGGREVAAAAGIRRLSLELGGNCPALVLPDAPDHTWAALTAASTYNAGQSCAAPARVTTLASCYDDVVKALGAAVGELAAARDFGPLNNPDQLARYDRLVGGAAGASVQRGGITPAAGEEAGYWRPACVVADVPGDDPVVTEEVFGPVLTVEPVPSLEEAVTRANRMPQALAASVWSTDMACALTVARHLDAGEVWVNCHLVQTAELPHGGRRASGTGTDLSVLALDEYQRPKTITAYLGS